MKKYIVLTAGIISQTAIGGIYAWSIFVPELKTRYSLTAMQCALIFGVMVAVFAFTTIPAGRILVRSGPRRTAGTGALLFGSGYILASFSGGNFFLLLLSLGLVAGAGIGFSYVCPLTLGMEWFPRHRGLVTGLSVAGFGLGAVLLSRIAVVLLENNGILIVFRIIGFSLGLAAFLSAMCMARPAGADKNTGKRSGFSSAGNDSIIRDLLSPAFLLLCLGMLSGTFAGLLISGNLKPLKLSLGLTLSQASMTISLFAAGNTVGRLFWGQVHDRIRSRRTILFSLGFLMAALLPLLLPLPAGVYQFISIPAGFGFGACFVVYASSVAELFGTEKMPQLYPVCFSTYGLAALTGPAAGGFMSDIFRSYIPGIIISLILLIVSIILISLYLPDKHYDVQKKIDKQPA